MAIYFIGGPPKCGKTTLAKMMSKKLNIPWMSSDTLENIVWAYTPKEKHEALFPHGYLRGDSNDVFYANHAPEEIVQGYVEQSKATENALSMMAETYLKDEDDFIVEGYHVTPEVIHRILKKFGMEHVRAVFLTKKNISELEKNFSKSTTPNDWILRKTKEPATFTKIADMIATYSQHTESEAKKYGLRVFETDIDFKNTMEKAMKHLQM